jgi:hypothetical protein
MNGFAALDIRHRRRYIVDKAAPDMPLPPFFIFTLFSSPVRCLHRFWA